MGYPFTLNIKKFRSIEEHTTIPLTTKTTFIVGQNNSGKSNILRCLAAIFNGKLDVGDSDYEYEIVVTEPEFLIDSIPRNCFNAINSDEIKVRLAPGKPHIPQNVPEKVNKYASSGQFLNDFGRSVDTQRNLHAIYHNIFTHISTKLKGTVYVPTTRFITQSQKEPERFTNFSMPGETISYGTIIEQLAEMDRPPTEKKGTSH